MKKQLPGFIAGLLCSVVLFGLTVGAGALITGPTDINVSPINIMVDGKVFQPKNANGENVDVFNYGGTTYVPLRAIAETFGLEVGWDAEKNLATVSLDTHTSQNKEDDTTQDNQTHEQNGASITGLVLSSESLNITPGEVIEIRCTCTPNDACPILVLTSSNQSVATVDNLGTEKSTVSGFYVAKMSITAISPGTTTITATAQNGVSKEIIVTVSADNTEKAQYAVNALKSILKNPSSLTLNSVRAYKGSETYIIEIDYSAMNGFGGYNRGYYKYSGSANTTENYSSIDKYGRQYETIDISKLKY